jgi:hypothetical protein
MIIVEKIPRSRSRKTPCAVHHGLLYLPIRCSHQLSPRTAQDQPHFPPCHHSRKQTELRTLPGQFQEAPKNMPYSLKGRNVLITGGSR